MPYDCCIYLLVCKVSPGCCGLGQSLGRKVKLCNNMSDSSQLDTQWQLGYLCPARPRPAWPGGCYMLAPLVVVAAALVFDTGERGRQSKCNETETLKWHQSHKSNKITNAVTAGGRGVGGWLTDCGICNSHKPNKRQAAKRNYKQQKTQQSCLDSFANFHFCSESPANCCCCCCCWQTACGMRHAWLR